MKILIEKHQEFKRETHSAFVNFKNAFDLVNGKELLRILASDKSHNKPLNYIYIYCNVLGVLYSRWNFIALQKSTHYS
jgi:hypothetical protein